jgi:hypothetical protein
LKHTDLFHPDYYEERVEYGYVHAYMHTHMRTHMRTHTHMHIHRPPLLTHHHPYILIHTPSERMALCSAVRDAHRKQSTTVTTEAM